MSYDDEALRHLADALNAQVPPGNRSRFLNHLAGVSEDRPHARAYIYDPWGGEIIPLVGQVPLGPTSTRLVPDVLPPFGTTPKTLEVFAWASQSNRPNRS